MEQSGLKLKIVAGSRAFELNGKLDPGKATRFARIVYFVVKSEEEEFMIVLEKGNRPLAKAVVFTEELMSYKLNLLKRKLLDLSGKPVGNVKMKGEKSKNLSLPHNNSFWKENISKGKQGGVML